MAILVTGGAGYIGSQMVWHLVDRGETVIVLDNLTTGFDWLLPPQVKLVRGEVGDPAVLNRIMGTGDIDSVMHFAGVISVPESVEQPLKYYEQNTQQSRTLLDACVRHGVNNFLFSSTAAIYNVEGNDAISEDTPANPLSPYGRSKWMTEMMLEDTCAAHGLRYGILRYFNVAGADHKGRTGQASLESRHLIKMAVQVALGQRDSLAIYGEDYPTRDGTCIRDYIHVEDLADAHLLVLGHLREGGGSGVFNCGYGSGYSIREVIAALEAVMGREIEKHSGPRRAGDAPALVADSTKLQDQLGWAPKYNDLQDIISTALEWERHLIARKTAGGTLSPIST